MTPQTSSSFGASGRLRNTLRAVVPIRLSAAERAKISAAAERRGLTLSAFLREAGLRDARDTQGGSGQKSHPHKSPYRAKSANAELAPARPLLVLEHVPVREHIVDGERV